MTVSCDCPSASGTPSSGAAACCEQFQGGVQHLPNGGGVRLNLGSLRPAWRGTSPPKAVKRNPAPLLLPFQMAPYMERSSPEAMLSANVCDLVFAEALMSWTSKQAYSFSLHPQAAPPRRSLLARREARPRERVTIRARPGCSILDSADGGGDRSSCDCGMSGTLTRRPPLPSQQQRPNATTY